MQRSTRFQIVARLALALALALLASPAAAQPTQADSETARELMRHGDARLKAGDAAGALHHYEQARALVSVPTTGLAVARAQAALGRLLEARDTARAVTGLPSSESEHELLRRAREQATALLEDLARRIPKLQIEVTGAPRGSTYALSIDERTLAAGEVEAPLEVNPGRHRIVARTAGREPAVAEVTVAEGVTVPVRLSLEPKRADGPAAGPPPAPIQDAPSTGPGPSPLVFVGYGVAVAGLAVGTATGLLSNARVSSAEDHCEGNRCQPQAQDDIDAAQTLAHLSNVGFGVAIVGAAVGTYALFADAGSPAPTSPGGVRVQPLLSAGFLGLRGSY